MLETHPQPASGDRDVVMRCIEACIDCAATCTSCADADVGERDLRPARIHRLNETQAVRTGAVRRGVTGE
jgi:hypothetical protein